MRKRAFSAKIQRGVAVYGSRAELKRHQRMQKEQSLGQLQQSRKDIMVQRLELHNVRDQIELMFHSILKLQRKATHRTSRLHSAHQVNVAINQ